MALIKRNTGIDLDAVIHRFQEGVFNLLDTPEYESFDRVYNNPKSSSGTVPEAYILDGDYESTLYDDCVPLSSFFIDDDFREVLDNGKIKVKVALIFQVNLTEFLPLITHRADEEFNNRILVYSINYNRKFEFEFISMEKTINKVYREFDKSQIRFDDMSEKYVVRFNYYACYTPMEGSYCD